MNKDEIWKKVDGYDKYLISNYGRIKNLDYKRSHKEMLMSSGKIKNGYLVIVLSKNATRKTFLLHRLVANAFIPNPQNLPQVNHIDGDKTNNCVANLEWVTRKENVKHSFEKLGRISSTKGKEGGLSPAAKAVVQYYKRKRVAEYGSIKEASFRTGIDEVSISYSCRGIVKLAGGYRWKFKSK